MTVTKLAAGGYIATLFDVEGWTQRKEKPTRFGHKSVILKLSKTIRSKYFEYSGLPLKLGHTHNLEKYKTYHHAINRNREYVNYYEEKEVG